MIQDIPEYNGIGVYALVDDLGRMYIGSSQQVHRRIKLHEVVIRKGKAAKKIREAVAAGRVFHCVILEKMDWGSVNRYDLREREFYFIEKYDTIANGYNASTRPETQARREEDIRTRLRGRTLPHHEKLKAPILPPKYGKKKVN